MQASSNSYFLSAFQKANSLHRRLHVVAPISGVSANKSGSIGPLRNGAHATELRERRPATILNARHVRRPPYCPAAEAPPALFSARRFEYRERRWFSVFAGR